MQICPFLKIHPFPSTHLLSWRDWMRYRNLNVYRWTITTLIRRANAYAGLGLCYSRSIWKETIHFPFSPLTLSIVRSFCPFCKSELWDVASVKGTLGHGRPATIQISLRIRAVWSESLLATFWMTKDAKFLYADNEDSDKILQMRRLMLVVFGSVFIRCNSSCCETPIRTHYN